MDLGIDPSHGFRSVRRIYAQTRSKKYDFLLEKYDFYCAKYEFFHNDIFVIFWRWQKGGDIFVILGSGI